MWAYIKKQRFWRDAGHFLEILTDDIRIILAQPRFLWRHWDLWLTTVFLAGVAASCWWLIAMLLVAVTPEFSGVIWGRWEILLLLFLGHATVSAFWFCVERVY